MEEVFKEEYRWPSIKLKSEFISSMLIEDVDYTKVSAEAHVRVKRNGIYYKVAVSDFEYIYSDSDKYVLIPKFLQKFHNSCRTLEVLWRVPENSDREGSDWVEDSSHLTNDEEYLLKLRL